MTAAEDTYSRPESFVSVPRPAPDRPVGADKRLIDPADYADVSSPRVGDPHGDDDEHGDGTGDPEGWGMIGATTGGLVAVGAGVWLFFLGGWAAVITATAVVGVIGAGGTYAARSGRLRRIRGHGTRTPRAARRASGWSGPSLGRLPKPGRSSTSGGSGSRTSSATGRTSTSGLRMPRLAKATPTRAAAATRSAAASPTRAGRRTVGASSTTSGMRRSALTRAVRSGAIPAAPRAGHTPSRRASAAATRATRRHGIAHNAGALLMAGADGYASYLKAQSDGKFLKGKDNRVGPFQWWLLNALANYGEYLRNGKYPTRNLKDLGKAKPAKSTRPPSASPPGAAAPTPEASTPGSESPVTEVPTPAPISTDRPGRHHEITPDGRPIVDPPVAAIDDAGWFPAWAAAPATAADAARPVTEPVRATPTPPAKPTVATRPVDDEIDGDAGHRDPASTIPTAHRMEYRMAGTRPSKASYTTHPHLEEAAHAFSVALSTFRPRVEDGVDVIKEMEAFTFAIVKLFQDFAVDLTFFADFVDTEYPSHPGWADYWHQLSTTATATAEAGEDAANANYVINADDHARRADPRGDIHREAQANISPGAW